MTWLDDVSVLGPAHLFAVLAIDQSVVQCTDGLVGDFLLNMEKLSVFVLLASSRNFLEASRFSLLLQKCTVAVQIVADRNKFLVVPLGWRKLIRNHHPF